MKYKFQCTDYHGNTLTSEFTAESIDEIIAYFKDFLAGVSFDQGLIKEYFDNDCP